MGVMIEEVTKTVEVSSQDLMDAGPKIREPARDNLGLMHECDFCAA